MATAAPNGNGFKNSTTFPTGVPAIFAEGNDKTICSQITVTNGDSANSVYHIGQIKSDSIIIPLSFAAVQAIAGLTLVNVGISGPGGQAVNAGVANCLVAAADWHAGSMNQSITSALTAQTAQNRAWQLAGLAADPGGNLEVYMTAVNAPAGTGVITFFLDHLRNL